MLARPQLFFVLLGVLGGLGGSIAFDLLGG